MTDIALARARLADMQIPRSPVSVRHDEDVYVLSGDGKTMVLDRAEAVKLCIAMRYALSYETAQEQPQEVS